MKITASSENTCTAHGPFDREFLLIITALSGKKQWSNGNVEFELNPGNVRLLQSLNIKIEWPEGFTLIKPPKTIPEAISMDGYTPGMPLMKHQQDTLNKSKGAVNFAHLHEMGLGKTAIMIAEMGMLHKAKAITGVLILAPKGVHRQWLTEQVPLHMDKSINVHTETWSGKIFDMKKKSGLTILSMNIDAIRTERGYNTAQTFLKMHNGQSMMIIDESHLIKTGSAQRTKAAWHLGSLATFRRIATGTPIAKNIVDAWSQFKFLDVNLLGYKYMTAFRTRYCIMGGFEGRQIIGQRNLEEFYSLIDPHSFRLTKAEALDLPPKIYATREYEMSHKTRQHYNELKKTFMTALDNGEIIDVQNAAVMLLRLQQVICGYLPGEEGFASLGRERIDTLLDIIEQLDGPTVIWCRFIEDIRRIEEELEMLGYEVATYYGSTGTKDRTAAVKDFCSGKVQFFVSNPAAGGVGLNLQSSGCQNVIYYSNSFDALHRWQSEDRVHRVGTRGAVTYFDIVAIGSIDRHILRNLRSKRSISDLSLDQIRKAICDV